MSTSPKLDVELARSQFPSLKSGFAFAENAGGSQAAVQVVDRISDYLLNTNVQLGATYTLSLESTKRVLVDGPTEAAKLFGAGADPNAGLEEVHPDEVVFGSSSTLNLENLSRALEPDILGDEELIVQGEHEANVGPWKKLGARKGLIVRHWKPRLIDAANPYSLIHDVSDLLPLITSKTRIVAFIAEVVKVIREEAKKKGARKVEISVDCVAYAPHRAMDVKGWDVDYCVFSYYKIYGPHISALYVRAASLESSLTSIVHHFLDVSKVAYKLQPGGPGYEIVYGSTGVNEYLLSLTPERNLKATFDAFALHEQTLITRLLGWLTDDKRRERGVRIVGEETASLNRVPTISFAVVGDKPLKSKDIVDAFDKKGKIGIRNGHFYCYTLVKELPAVDIDDGLVRISLVHYNILEEVEKIIASLEEILA